MTYKILIVGGGIGGMSTAIKLTEAGHRIDLIDLDPDWRVYGAGITITGPTLRAYKRLGLLDAIKQNGAITPGTRIRAFDGTLLAELSEPPLSDDIPGTGGILRPALHRIMSERVRALPISVRLGITVDQIAQDGSGVDVALSDGSAGRYDIVIGADGIKSRVRQLVFPHAVIPAYTGQCAWRVVGVRPAGLDKGEFFTGHQNFVGITATGPASVYLFLLNPDPGPRRIEPADQPAILRALLADFGGNAGMIRDAIDADTPLVYRPLEAGYQPRPWHIGRVVIIGDAAHATTPHLASGAGLAVEDALVVAEELERHDDVEAALAAFTERRFDRCSNVVRTGIAIGANQIAQGPPQRTGELIGAALHALSEEY